MVLKCYSQSTLHGHRTSAEITLNTQNPVYIHSQRLILYPLHTSTDQSYRLFFSHANFASIRNGISQRYSDGYRCFFVFSSHLYRQTRVKRLKIALKKLPKQNLITVLISTDSGGRTVRFSRLFGVDKHGDYKG